VCIERDANRPFDPDFGNILPFSRIRPASHHIDRMPLRRRRHSEACIRACSKAAALRESGNLLRKAG